MNMKRCPLETKMEQLVAHNFPALNVCFYFLLLVPSHTCWCVYETRWVYSQERIYFSCPFNLMMTSVIKMHH